MSLRAAPGEANLREEFKAKTFAIFDFNDAVEAQTYDRLNSRLAISSHSGCVKMFFVDKSEQYHHIIGLKSGQLIFPSSVIETGVEYQYWPDNSSLSYVLWGCTRATVDVRSGKRGDVRFSQHQLLNLLINDYSCCREAQTSNLLWEKTIDGAM